MNITSSPPAFIITGANGTLIGTTSGTQLLSTSGASDGDVLTVQADGSLAYEAPAGGGASSPLVLTASSATELPLEIELASAQTENAFEINTNGGSGGDLLNVDASGDLNLENDLVINGNVAHKSSPTTRYFDPLNTWKTDQAMMLTGSVIRFYGASGASGNNYCATTQGTGIDGSKLINFGCHYINDINFGNSEIAGSPTADLNIGRVTLEGSSAYASATTNIVGALVEIIAGNGASGSAGNAHGGNVEITPGTGYGTGHNGYIILNNLPTSDPGVTGALWNNSGVLTVS